MEKQISMNFLFVSLNEGKPTILGWQILLEINHIAMETMPNNHWNVVAIYVF